MKQRLSWGEFLYGTLFVVGLPALLALWAHAAEASVCLTAVKSVSIGTALISFGLTLVALGWIALYVHGGGLPMNPFPASRFVARGIYNLVSHPIYIGFVFACLGVAVVSASASGLWLVTPVAALGCVALVWGYERHDLQRRFGERVVRPLLSLPSDGVTRASFSERIAVYLLVLLPWLALYEAVRRLGIPCDAVSAYLPFEKTWPVYEWTEAIYGSGYLFVGFAPLAARSSRDLREFSTAGLIATGLVILLFVLVPFVAPPRPFQAQTWLGQLLLWERNNDTAAAAFPSFHVVWALLTARVYAARWRSMRWLWWGWAWAIAVSCLTTGMHALIDVAAAIVVVYSVNRVGTIWESIRKFSERVANSWGEWRIGPVRVINHGAYAGAGVFMGLLLIEIVVGAKNTWFVLLVASCALVAAGLWAQFVEGSPSLMRPFGYYGGVFGVLIGVVLVRLLGGDAWLLVAAYAVAGPWIQAAGRLRCLVNGCCHGRQARPSVGIRYTHPRTRVCRLANLSGVPLHPTQTYSILWNVAVGLLLARLWAVGTPLSLIAGLYLILNGLGRFVEEAYRGEPQTPLIAGLRLYQWLAIVSVMAGTVITVFDGARATMALEVDWLSFVVATGFGLLTWFAMGVDFPDSNTRFARLA